MLRKISLKKIDFTSDFLIKTGAFIFGVIAIIITLYLTKLLK